MIQRSLNSEHRQDGSVVVGATGSRRSGIENTLPARECFWKQRLAYVRMMGQDDVLEVVSRIPPPTDWPGQNTTGVEHHSANTSSARHHDEVIAAPLGIDLARPRRGASLRVGQQRRNHPGYS
jgi:hypothetical protein